MDIFRRIRKYRWFAYLLLIAGCDNARLDPQFVPDGIVTDVKLKFTPVRNQGRSELCWAYAMAGVWESEHMMADDTVSVSVNYIGRMFLEEVVRDYFLSGGEERLDLRGVGPMTFTLMDRYGALPEEVYGSAPFNFLEKISEIRTWADEALGKCRTQEDRKAAFPSFINKVKSSLDEELGVVPDSFVVNDRTFTPAEYASYIIGGEKYVTLMCDTDRDYVEGVDPCLTDNRFGCMADNVCPDTLASRVDASVRNGHAVMWEGGPNDNHAVVIVGIVHDRYKVKYFVAKNSWGTNNPTHGFLFIPESYLKRHTALVCFAD